MEKDIESEKPKAIKETKGTLIADMYYMVEDWMRPSPKRPKFLQVILFIIKLPALVVLLAVSPILLLFMFITLIVAL
ncbi:hypothetical protein LX77_03760 [Gelidibacter algens]|jgi:hypothetical protein|uniref:Uncharacterized protein n=1 Tax=Gelidibacter algens TaxID=49280 RepID=A0A1A7QXM0_9FLAO|nr:hypothetical protein [Gelidibacter algens]OBX23282.1 hypothetical protein A9996_16035 [Gelidibacter algens]RAJ18657.1 hypothetical protein LX77_03760 [Gelidibacter algens]